MQRIIRGFLDLAITLDNYTMVDLPFMRPQISYQTHADITGEPARFFPGIAAEQTPDGAGFAAAETVTLSTRNGTHPRCAMALHPTMAGGARAITIDEVPLDWCFRPGAKLDFRHFEDGCGVRVADVEALLARIGHELQPLDIVLVNTRAGERLGQPEFLPAGCGMGREATLYFTTRGLHVTGTDAWSWDAPFVHTARRVAETGDTSLI